MYFDAVLDDHDVLFNGTSEETKEFLVANSFPEETSIKVVQGSSMKMFSPREYLDLML
jgi:hypothetical protein